jgi:hypothetical protein
MVMPLKNTIQVMGKKGLVKSDGYKNALSGQKSRRALKGGY